MKRYYVSALAALVLTTSLYADSPEAYIGSIWASGLSYCPTNTLPANGKIVNINDYQPLFALIGTIYGGDGKTTFALPNLNGRTPVGLTNGLSSSSPVVLGTTRGQATLPLTAANLPPHTHSASFTPSGTNTITVNIPASSNLTGNTNQPSSTNNYIAASSNGPGGANMWANTMTTPVTIKGVTTSGGSGSGSVAISNTGNTAPIMTVPPELGVTYCITVTGLFPPQP